MLDTKRVAAMFAEAHDAYEQAISVLDEATRLWDRGMLRKSAEQTWTAALTATNALIMARTGVDPQADDDDWTYDRLLRLLWEDQEANQDLKPVKGRYGVISHDIYEGAVLEGNVDPVYLLIHDIHNTADYIRDCERLAGESG